MRLGAALIAAGAPFSVQDAEARSEIVREFEKAEPRWFGSTYDTCVLAYYESPVIVKLIDAAGHPYRVRPLVKGYALPGFDRASQIPSHGARPILAHR